MVVGHRVPTNFFDLFEDVPCFFSWDPRNQVYQCSNEPLYHMTRSEGGLPS